MQRFWENNSARLYTLVVPAKRPFYRYGINKTRRMRSIDSFFRPAPPVRTSSASSAPSARSAPSAPFALSTSSSSSSVASSAPKPKQRRSGHDRFKGRDTARSKKRASAILALEELGMGLEPFARQPVPRGRKKGKPSEVSVREQSRMHNTADTQASPPSWCHSGAERGLTKEFRDEIIAAAKSTEKSKKIK